MGGSFAQWLVGSFTILGIQFQNWMAVAAVMLLLWLGYLSLKGRRGNPDLDG